MILPPFVAVPRYIKEHLHGRKLTRSEFWLLLWIRLSANKFGVATVSIAGLRGDVFPYLKGRAGENTTTKHLTLLKRKKYIYYHGRQGSRGSFEVHMNDWPLGKGKIKTLDGLFNNTGKIKELATTEVQAEVSQNFEPQIQKLDEAKRQLAQGFSANKSPAPFRTPNTDTNTQTDTNTNNTLVKKSFQFVRVADFQPNNNDEQRCKEIAVAVNDEFINVWLKIMRQHGLPVLERAFGIYKEDLAQGKKIGNHAAYLNGIVKKLIEGNSAESFDSS